MFQQKKSRSSRNSSPAKFLRSFMLGPHVFAPLLSVDVEIPTTLNFVFLETTLLDKTKSDKILVGQNYWSDKILVIS